LISNKDRFDPRELAEFKEFVLACQGSFKKHLKIFGCFTMKFRHGVDNYKVAFEAAFVIATYEIENGSPLFDAYPTGI
jgi:hypothetical protein